MSRISASILSLYQKVFCRKLFYPLNKGLYFLSLKGIGIGNWENARLSGEDRFLDWFAGRGDAPLVIDIGANVGTYSRMVRAKLPDARILAAEPHPKTFRALRSAASELGFEAHNIAFGDSEGKGLLFDHPMGEGDVGTEHASMVPGVIETTHSSESEQWEVSVATLDRFLSENDIDEVDLLKIDVEGGELAVLRGGQDALSSGRIRLIHFEFTESNVQGRTFMKDFYDLLSVYSFYRMLPDGLVPLGEYYPLLFEIFRYQNIVAIYRDETGSEEK